MRHALLCAALTLSLASAARADGDLPGAFGRAQEILARARPDGAPAPKVKLTTDEKAALTAYGARKLMQDAGGTGLRLVMALDDTGRGVELATLGKEVCALVEREVYPNEYRDVVTCDSAALAAMTPRAATLYIAEQIALLRWKDALPNCAERDFIVASLMARSWLEAGGELDKLPALDGRRDDARAARIKAWRASKLQDYARARRAKGEPTLPGLIEANDDTQAAVLRAINELNAKFRLATCQLDELVILRVLDEKRAELESLRREKSKLEGLRDTSKVFAAEEADWAKLNWRMVGAAAR